MPTALTNHVAGEIRAEMARQKVTQIQMAAALHISQPVLSRMLSGDRPLSLDFVEACAELLNVPIWRLLDGPGGAPEPPRRFSPISPVSDEYAMLKGA